MQDSILSVGRVNGVTDKAVVYLKLCSYEYLGCFWNTCPRTLMRAEFGASGIPKTALHGTNWTVEGFR